MKSALLPGKIKQMTNTFIYTLGNGWYPYNYIPNTQKSPSILKGAMATNKDKFLPLSLFDGTLETVFGNYYNWRVAMQPHWNILSGQYIYELEVSMPEYGIKYDNFNFNQVTSQQLSNRRTVESQFKFFNENKRFQLFVVDFQNPSYRQYGNDKILQFEKYLEDHAFDLANFVYVEVEETFDAARYEGSKIQIFRFSNKDEAGVEGKQFALSKCFYAKKKDWVDEQVARIQAAYESSLPDNG